VRGEAVAAVTDVSQADEVEAMVRTAVDTFGGLSVLYNNAGTFPADPRAHFGVPAADLLAE
jgi:NAD(P)-dependent dehydrogenase (short-subunit alcohol dehydrogenase family)